MKLWREFNWKLKYKKIQKIKLLVLDVDGVLTDGTLNYSINGDVSKGFNVCDGLGIKMLQQYGIEVAIISGGKGGAAQARGEHLEIEHCFVEIKDKAKAIKKLKNITNHKSSETAYLGDDLNDLVVSKEVALLIAPIDANKYFKKRCNLILNKPGGKGAVRELSERILISRTDLWLQISKYGFKNKNV